MPENSLAKLLNLIKTNYFRKSESQEVSAISIDVTPTDSSTNLVTSGGVKTELDKLGQTQTDIYSRIEDVEEAIAGLELAGSGSWTKQQVALLETIFANIAYIDETTGQTAADRLIASLRGSTTKTHTVTFVADGVTVGTVTFAEGDTSVAEPDVPIKEHYIGVWQAYSLGTTDLTVKAVYTPITYTITFVDDGGNHAVTYTVLTADTVSAPTVTPRDGYTAAWPSWSVGYDNSQTVEAVYTPNTLTSITATYSGGTVAAGTTLDQLTGITVTATYSDGTTGAVTDYELSGTLTAGQSNTITVTYQGKTATFSVTVEAEPITLTGITAAYSGGNVAAGTTLDQLTGITVTATYSDGSTVTVAKGDYTLSGTLTAGQSNTVTATYQGKTATFVVTVEEESHEPTETEIALTWTAAKLVYDIGSAATSSTGATSFAYAHSQKITMEAGMTYKVVTGEISAMKGEHPKLGKWNYRIVFVDDDNIIRATTEIQAENADNVTVENIVTDPIFVSGSNASLATGFYVREYTAGSTGGNVGNPISNGMTNLTHLYKVG